MSGDPRLEGEPTRDEQGNYMDPMEPAPGYRAGGKYVHSNRIFGGPQPTATGEAIGRWRRDSAKEEEQ